MDNSERLERFLEDRGHDRNDDEELCIRIKELLNHPKIDEYCLVDAYYYDYSALPPPFIDEFLHDMYFLYGITTRGEMIHKWVDRWDLDSSLPIVDGEVKRKEE